MPRTRDLVVFLVTVLFLAGGIGVSVARQGVWEGAGGQVAAGIAAVPELGDLSATVAPKAEPDRASLLASMRQKVASAMKEAVAVIAPEPSEEVASEPANDGDEVVLSGEPTVDDEGAWECAGYGPRIPPSLAGTVMTVAEGMRVWAVPAAPVVPTVPVAADGSSTVPVVVPAPAVPAPVLALPVRTVPAGSPSCIATDVVGVARDGSYIRNDEAGLYSVFGAETLVGYALDGFPIYGVNDGAVTDRCGGMVVGGEYRYYLKGDQDHLISCFAATPSNL